MFHFGVAIKEDKCCQFLLYRITIEAFWQQMMWRKYTTSQTSYMWISIPNRWMYVVGKYHFEDLYYSGHSKIHKRSIVTVKAFSHDANAVKHNSFDKVWKSTGIFSLPTTKENISLFRSSLLLSDTLLMPVCIIPPLSRYHICC